MNTKEATKPLADEMSIAEMATHERRLRVIAREITELTRHLYNVVRMEGLRIPVALDLAHCTIEIKEGVELDQPHVSLIFKKHPFEQSEDDGSTTGLNN